MASLSCSAASKGPELQPALKYPPPRYVPRQRQHPVALPAHASGGCSRRRWRNAPAKLYENASPLADRPSQRETTSLGRSRREGRGCQARRNMVGMHRHGRRRYLRPRRRDLARSLRRAHRHGYDGSREHGWLYRRLGAAPCSSNRADVGMQIICSVRIRRAWSGEPRSACRLADDAGFERGGNRQRLGGRARGAGHRRLAWHQARLRGRRWHCWLPRPTGRT